ncbi:MAG: M14 family zinc carboxypeptidase, partial [Bacteroidales bacterium]
MIKKISRIIICIVLSSTPLLSLQAQELSFFYPDEIQNLESTILSPNQFFGTPMGEHHLQYESVVAYMQYLNSVSPRVLIQLVGKTHQQKPIIAVVISSKERLAPYKKEAPPSLHQLGKELYPGREQFGQEELINWLGYSVHGNEASGVNSSVITAYLLVSSTDSYVENILENSITVIIPAINPDGVNKYATWVNSNLARAGNNDRYSIEFNPPAPSARSNHYWLDLNRDWLVATQPEGKAIQRLYHNWLPNIVNDYHEQGGTGGSYFAPG